MNLKYILEFTGVKGKTTVQFLTNEDVSEVITLQGGATPLTIEYDGDSDKHFQIIYSSVTINFISQTGIFEDIARISDKTYWIDIQTPYMSWGGWLRADNMTRYLTTNGYEISVVAKDPFTLGKGITDILSRTDWTSYLSSATMDKQVALFKIGDIIQKCITEMVPFTFGINIVSDIKVDSNYSVLDGYICQDSLLDNDGGTDTTTIVENLGNSYPYKIFWQNNTFYLVDYAYYLQGGRSCIDYNKEITDINFDNSIGTLGNKDNFMISALEDVQINMIPAIKKYSVKYSDDSLISVLNNPQFVRGFFDYWNKKDSVTGDVVKVGDGSKLDQFAARVYDNDSEEDNIYTMGAENLWQASPIVSAKGDSALLDLTFSSKTANVLFNIYLLKSPINGLNNDNIMHVFAQVSSQDVGQWYSRSDYFGDQNKQYRLWNANTAYYSTGISINNKVTTSLNISATPDRGYIAIVFYGDRINGTTQIEEFYYDLFNVSLQLNPQDKSNQYASYSFVKEETYNVSQTGDYSYTLEDDDCILCEKYNLNAKYSFFCGSSIKNDKYQHYRDSDTSKVDLLSLKATDSMRLRRKPCYTLQVNIFGFVNMFDFIDVEGFSNKFSCTSLTYNPLINECQLEMIECNYQIDNSDKRSQETDLLSGFNIDGGYVI